MRPLAMASLGVALFALAVPASAAEKEYILTGAAPNKLYLIDVKARKVTRAYDLTQPDWVPSFIEASPDNKIAYVVANQAKTIVGIDLKTGGEVFRAAMSHADNERAINLGLAVSPDGAKIYSYEIPLRALPDRFEVQPNRISVYAATGGLAARPKAVFGNMPRRIHMLLFSKDGKQLYALGSDFYTLDPMTGRIIAAYPLRQWQRPNATPYDLLNFWPTPESSGVFTVIVSDERATLAPGDLGAGASALLNLDLKKSALTVAPIKGVTDTLFTVTASPDKKFGYGGFRRLHKIDLKRRVVIKHVELDRSYYQFNVSRDGREVYIGGATCDIALHATADLAKKASVALPGCLDMAGAALRVIKLDLGK